MLQFKLALAAMVAMGIAASTAGPASAQYVDQLSQCHVPDSSCDSSQYEVQAADVTVGDPFTMYMDYDITTPGTEVCQLFFFATFDSTKLAFFNARRMYVQSPQWGDTLWCDTAPDVPTEWCPTCDTVLFCDWYNQDYYRNLAPSVSAEIQLIFQTVAEGDTGVYADMWTAYGRDFEYNCDVDLALGAPEVTFPDVLVTVPEPGLGVMLAAGIPFVGYLSRRGRGRSRS